MLLLAQFLLVKPQVLLIEFKVLLNSRIQRYFSQYLKARALEAYLLMVRYHLSLCFPGVTFGKLFNLSMPQFPHLQNGRNNISYFTELLTGLNDLISCEMLGQYLSQGQHSISVIKVIKQGGHQPDLALMPCQPSKENQNLCQNQFLKDKKNNQSQK